MPIHILPPQLANQIAAGEVVERPASVVKELVENSLDAGATDIRIDIENGGSNLILIRDNGSGIAKAELNLALARHATSKIATLEDLESILSLGFRGEALASISSVSRLTLTSRTQEQNEAWQIYAQGREMETTLKPASHPIGTTVEVANLFFNTPARRKFLRTNKTEFNHIDEIIRRIALAKPQIAFTLTHNNKIIRQYKNAINNQQKVKRIATICGDDFIQHALQLDWQHDDLHLYGWIAQPQFYRTQNDLNYSYVNGRMVRDKVINHAIRQAYTEHLNIEQYPAFVLFIDLNPNEVDVNVHPAKHEVRFHQARLIHDFIYQGISHALSSEQANFVESPQTDNQQVSEPQVHWNTIQTKPNRVAAGSNIFTSPSSNSSKTTNYAPHFKKNEQDQRPLYAELINTPSDKASELFSTVTTPKSAVVNTNENSGFLRALALIKQQALLLQHNQQFYLLLLKHLQQIKLELSLQQKEIAQQPLLIPLIFRLNEQQLLHWAHQKKFFEQIGFKFTEHLVQHRITLNTVPNCLRQQNFQKLVLSLLTEQINDITEFLSILYKQLQLHEINIFADALNLLTETEQLIEKQNKISLQAYFIPIDFEQYLTSN